MKTVLEILNLSAEYLQQRNVQSPRRQAEELISAALQIARVQLYMEFDRPLAETELNLIRARLVRRGKGEPLQYIHGEVEFLDCLIKVSPAVLIPRQETELLVDTIIKSLATQNLEGKILWDVCCGSGCIGIALKKKFPELEVVLSDISSDALQVAKENAQVNEVSVSFEEGDLLAPFVGKKTNFLVCNPPYVTEEEYTQLDAEVSKYEPRTALVSGETGLEFYQRLANGLAGVLESSGNAWFEIGKGQGHAVEQLFSGAPWVRSQSERDWAGHDRFFFLEKE
jgi:release factor glutamine methyltransferase